MTFSVTAQVYRYEKYGWQRHFEVFAQCKKCLKPSIFLLSQKDYDQKDPFMRENALIEFPMALNNAFNCQGFVGLRENIRVELPEHLTPALQQGFREGATCFVIGCYNASGTMFRLCVDLVTRPLLPSPEDTSRAQPNSKQRRDLGLRVQWLFDQDILPTGLRQLAQCIQQDGNDGAHAGNLRKEDAEDIQEFTKLLLERLISEPKNLELAEARRVARRAQAKKAPA